MEESPMTAPASILRSVPVGEIAALFASLPRLTPEEVAASARDIEAARRKPSDPLADPWNSSVEVATNPKG
jgi:hypothetical protein